MKRIFDFIFSAICLVVFAPLFAICYVAIRLEDGLPVIYRQERIGLHGKPFYIYKFRSMTHDAEKDGPQLLLDGALSDPRLTKTGKWMRAHHLDELPQLWNVLKGDMAFIGYRPERKFYIDQIMEHNPRFAGISMDQVFGYVTGVDYGTALKTWVETAVNGSQAL